MNEGVAQATRESVNHDMMTDVSRVLSQGRTDRTLQGPPERTRLRLKPKAPPTGAHDGAWWPHGDDLSTALPDLLAVLSVRLGAIDRVLYRFADWATAPAKLVTGGRAVRLDGYRLQPPNTIEVLGFERNRIVLLVVPPQTDPDCAHAIMKAAVTPGDASSPADLAASREALSLRQSRTQSAAAEARWDSEGGALDHARDGGPMALSVTAALDDDPGKGGPQCAC